jgi:16S rRNA (cytidine1402-2'-O)-methyltransferase
LLSHFQIKKPLLSYHDFSSIKKENKILELLLNGKNIALISDAGMPLISDPGYDLVRLALEKNIALKVIPGPTALTTALAVSGLPTDRFCFEGFLKSKPAERQKQLQSLQTETRTIIFYEAPHRIRETLQDILNILGDRDCFLGRELTKKYEEHYHGSISQVLTKLGDNLVRGELVLIITGNQKQEKPNQKNYLDLIKILRKKNISNKEIVEILSSGLGLPKNFLKKELF